jgi:hypothetical protein
MKPAVGIRIRCALLALLLALDAHRVLHADVPPGAAAAFDTYARQVEQRLRFQHASGPTFLASSGGAASISLHTGTLRIERVTEPTPSPSPDALATAAGARLDHWRGTAFVPGVTAEQFESLLRDVSHYPTTFAPQVEQARIVASSPDRLLVTMRVRQHHVLTVVMDAAYDVTFAHLDPAHGYSLSRSTRIAELDAPGTPREHPLPPAGEHGFLYRLNTFWSWEQRDGGLYLQIETISLSRAIPRGLHWIVGPYVDSIPRDSLAFTLTSARNALLAERQRHPPAHAS